MIILHTCWREGSVAVWGETQADASPCAAASGAGALRRSPFDAGEKRVRAVLALLFGCEPDRFAWTDMSLRLPTRGMAAAERPVPSLAFLETGAQNESSGDEAFEAGLWSVQGCPLTWQEAFALFERCRERRLAEGVFADTDLLALTELFRYAGALVARGRFLPDLRFAPSGAAEARWLPAYDRAEARRFACLACRLPPAAAGGQDPQTVAAAFLEEMVDRLVRVSVVTTLSRAQAERGRHYSAHDAWFAALRGDSRMIRWENAQELAHLQAQLETWRNPVRAGDPRDELRLTLQEPARPDEPWRLTVRLTVETDRPLPETRLLALGQAALLFPPLGLAEPDGTELVARLTTPEAHLFLTSAADLLAAAGFEVERPAWWKSENAPTLALAAEVTPRAAEPSAKGAALLEEKTSVRWTVTLQNEGVPADELQRLLSSPSPLVFFRGRWHLFDPRHLQSALRVARAGHSETRTALEVLRLALGTGGGHVSLPVDTVRASGWMESFLQRLNGEQNFAIPPPPDRFCGELRPYQLRGLGWLTCLRNWGFGACLADDMGLGKTVQALAFLLQEKNAGETRPVLLAGPMSVLGNWLREVQRFTPTLRCHLHHGPQRAHGNSFQEAAAQADLVITSYPLLHRDYADLRKVRWAGIVLDEAQNIKNPDTRQAQAARALTAEYRLALTGTPMENHVGDLWAVMDFLNPGMLGKRAVFRERFFRPIQSGTDPGARTRLRRFTKPFILRRLKTDRQIIADLPGKIEAKVCCPLTAEQARLYQEVLRAFERELEAAEGLARRGLILAVLTRLKQVCNHPVHYLGRGRVLRRRSGKLERLGEMLEEVFARGESALVFTQYAAMGALLKQHLCETFGREMPFLHGGVPRRARDQMVQRFQQAEEPLAFVLSLKAGGTGLNLTRASQVFHYDRWWNPAVENQATDRAFRIGQSREVLVHKFLCGGTLEDRIDAMITAKTALTDEIVTSGETFLTELSNRELRDVLQLDAGAEYRWEVDPGEETWDDE